MTSLLDAYSACPNPRTGVNDGWAGIWGYDGWWLFWIIRIRECNMRRIDLGNSPGAIVGIVSRVMDNHAHVTSSTALGPMPYARLTSLISFAPLSISRLPTKPSIHPQKSLIT